MKRPRGALELGAAALALPIALAASLSRLPVVDVFLLPRGCGSEALLALSDIGRGALRPLLPWTTLLVAACCAALVLVPAWKARGRATLWRGLGAVAGFLLLGRAAGLAVRAGLDLIQNAYFPPESLSALEPLGAWLLVAVSCALFLRAAALLADWAAGAAQADWARRFLVCSASLAAFALGVAGWGVALDSRHGSAESAAGLAGLPDERLNVALFSERDGRPYRELHEKELHGPKALSRLESFAGSGRSLYKLAGLRLLYAQQAARLDLKGLRRALALGVEQSDPLARLYLLEHLANSAASPEAKALLDRLADESRMIVGPIAAARLSEAYSAQGEPAKSSAWRARAALGRDAVIPALGAGAQPKTEKPGSVRVKIRGRRPIRAALLALQPGVPPALGPRELAAAVAPAKDGSLVFTGLKPGEYALALAFEGESPKAPKGLIGAVRVQAGKALTLRDLSF